MTDTVARPSSVTVGRQVIQQEAEGLRQAAAMLSRSFETAVELVTDCGGIVVTTGMGKAGIVGQKVAATLSSTGTRSYFVHPGEALHGDLGKLRDDDVVLVFSTSGDTEEVCRMLWHVQTIGSPVILVTANADSRLAQTTDVVVHLGPLDEAGVLALAPTVSTTAMLAVGDALAIAASEKRGFERRDFARVHPGGALGKRLRERL